MSASLLVQYLAQALRSSIEPRLSNETAQVSKETGELSNPDHVYELAA